MSDEKARKMSDEKARTTCLSNSQLYASEYCANSSIHGCKFLGEKNRSLCERAFWLGVLTTCLFFCVTLILEAYQKWQISPVVVSFATSETPVWKIPFPAVTICPEAKTRKALVNFTNLVLMKKRGERLTEEQIKQFNYMSMICSNILSVNDGMFPFVTNDFYEFLFKVHPKLTDVVDECSWSGRNCTRDVDKIFSLIITRDGLCFSFNLENKIKLFSDDVTLDYYDLHDMQHQSSSKEQPESNVSYIESDGPRHAMVAGVTGGLQLTLKVNSENLDYFCGDALQGYKIILHNPNVLPFVKQKYFRVGLNQVATVSVKPIIVETSSQLKHYHPKKRQCYFPEERKLRYFKVYDQNNCLQECMSNITLRECGCVSFEIPHLNSTPICGNGKTKCVVDAMGKICIHVGSDQVKLGKYVFVQDSKTDHNNFQSLMEKCDCKQTCSSLSFETELSQVDWKWQKRTKVLTTDGYLQKGNEYTQLLIFFKDMQFISSERNELYGLMDFLSSCGGLLGLFIGFSFISLIEFLYFITLRLFCNYRRLGHRNWAGESV